MDLTQLFCDIDDFVKAFEKNNLSFFLISKSNGHGRTPAHMSLAEIMTIIVLYHSSGFKNFKTFYFFMREQMRQEFPKILSYSRFVEWMPYCLLPLGLFLKNKTGQITGISFIDSTSIAVCHNIRINRNRVFKDTATRGKTSMGWFFGFKLHLIVNEVGEILNFKVTTGKAHDTTPVKNLCKDLWGKLFGDKGYLSEKLFSELWGSGIHLITNVRRNMKNKLISIEDKILLRKRFIIETINDQLKNISDIEHTRHRSPINFLVNLLASLISYTYKSKKPSIKWSITPSTLMI
jgi:hypothetical protein